MNILSFLDTIAPLITILAFVLLWYQISRLKKITPKEEEWARTVQTLDKQFTELSENITKGKFGSGKQVKELGVIVGNLNKTIENLWRSMKKALKLSN